MVSPCRASHSTVRSSDISQRWELDTGCPRWDTGGYRGLGEGRASRGLRLRGGPRSISRSEKWGACPPPRVRPVGLPAAGSAGLCSPDPASGSRNSPAAGSPGPGLALGAGAPGSRGRKPRAQELPSSVVRSRPEPARQPDLGRAQTHRRVEWQELGGLCGGHQTGERAGREAGGQGEGPVGARRPKRPARNAVGRLGDVRRRNNAEAHGLFSGLMWKRRTSHSREALRRADEVSRQLWTPTKV